jgi:regulator of sigma E protease
VARAKDKPVIIAYMREGVAGTVAIPPQPGASQPGAPQSSAPQPGMNSETKPPSSLFGATLVIAYTPVTKHIAPWTQIAYVFTRAWNALSSLASPRSDIGLNNMSGPIGIGKMLLDAAKYDFIALLALVLFINVSLAIFNMLPIPALDGGHIMLATIEKLRGRPLPLRLVMTLQSVFMLLLVSMILYVSFFDVRRNIPQSKPAAAPQSAK